MKRLMAQVIVQLRIVACHKQGMPQGTGHKTSVGTSDDASDEAIDDASEMQV